MNIREVAELAGVSVSTVSKVLNKKDDDIRPETRDRVLQIIKKYNYTPYLNTTKGGKTRSNSIGVLMNCEDDHEQLLTAMICKARAAGYSTVVCASKNKEEEICNAYALVSNNVDGIIWDRITPNEEISAIFNQEQIPYLVLDLKGNSGKNVVGIDYSDAGYKATEALIKNGHSRICCVVDDHNQADKEFVSGYRQCLFDNGIAADDALNVVVSEEEKFPGSLLYECSAVVCSSKRNTKQVLRSAESVNIRIHNDFCVVGSAHDNDGFEDIPYVRYPYIALAEDSVDCLVEVIEKKNSLDVLAENSLVNAQLIAFPSKQHKVNITVVGTINIDTIIMMDKINGIGETKTVDQRTMMPGGKGLNQSVAASRLGAYSYLIGSIGRDYYGGMVHEYLKNNHVNIDGIKQIKDCSTGCAYIYVLKNGESSIVVYDGANNSLTKRDLNTYKAYFEQSEFCLLQTEINSSIVEHAAELAKKSNCGVILKPCSTEKLSDKLIKCVDILVPNEKEIHKLVPGDQGIEEKAEYYHEKGIPIVIVTLGARGCYVCSEEMRAYFPAIDVESIDSTGGADAFIGALSVYLGKKLSLTDAIRYATFAAGLSTTRHGAPSSMVDEETLELFAMENGSNYQFRESV